jgi:hypothetical protein
MTVRAPMRESSVRRSSCRPAAKGAAVSVPERFSNGRTARTRGSRTASEDGSSAGPARCRRARVRVGCLGVGGAFHAGRRHVEHPRQDQNQRKPHDGQGQQELVRPCRKPGRGEENVQELECAGCHDDVRHAHPVDLAALEFHREVADGTERIGHGSWCKGGDGRPGRSWRRALATGTATGLKHSGASPVGPTVRMLPSREALLWHSS